MYVRNLEREEKTNMSEQSIKFQYQKGEVVGGYSFSAYNNVITLPKYVQKLENLKIREAIQYEAKTARSLYIEEVTRLKAKGKKINSSIVKREATKKAKDKAQTKYAEIWSEVEDTYNSPPPLYGAIPTSTIESTKPNIIHIKDVGILIIAKSDNLINKLIETIESHNEAARKMVDT